MRIKACYIYKLIVSHYSMFRYHNANQLPTTIVEENVSQFHGHEIPDITSDTLKCRSFLSSGARTTYEHVTMGDSLAVDHARGRNLLQSWFL